MDETCDTVACTVHIDMLTVDSNGIRAHQIIVGSHNFRIGFFALLRSFCCETVNIFIISVFNCIEQANIDDCNGTAARLNNVRLFFYFNKYKAIFQCAAKLCEKKEKLELFRL